MSVAATGVNVAVTSICVAVGSGGRVLVGAGRVAVAVQVGGRVLVGLGV